MDIPPPMDGSLTEEETKARPISSDLVVLLIIVVPILFVGIGARDVWAPDEPRFAQTAREMLESGDWLVPRMNDTPVALLPPMTSWTMAAASLPFGEVTEFSARIPVAIAALATVLAVFALGKLMFGPTGGVVAALMLATSLKFMQQAEWLQCDMLLVCFVTLALTSFWRAYQAPEGARRSHIPMYIFLALGTLTKGPMAVVLPAAVIVLFLPARKEAKYLLRMQLPVGILLWLLIVLPWFVAVHVAAGPAFTEELVLKQNFGMFFETWSHDEPFYYYFVNLPWAFLPWFVLVPAAAILCARGARWKEPPSLFLLIWFAAMFLFFTVSEAKQIKYLLVAFPALALITGWTLVTLDPRSRLFRWGVAVPLILPVLAVVALAVIVVGGWNLGAKAEVYRTVIDAARPVVCILAAGMVASLVALFKARHLVPAVIGMAFTLAVALPMARFLVIPEANNLKSSRLLCRQAAGIAPPGENLGLFGVDERQSGPYLYYTGKRLEVFSDNVGEFRAFMDSPAFRLCFADRKEYERIDDTIRKRYSVIAERSVGHREMLLIANHGGLQ